MTEGQVGAAHIDPIALSVFASRITAICEEMGAVLQRTSFSPNIRDRLDFSCAVFDAAGLLSAQAAHIPVHLGSMAYAMRDIVAAREWSPGDMVVLNDPYRGGTHLPDVTLIAPLFDRGSLGAFVVNRAHHADIGADSPGSMPLSSSLEEEGLVIPPTVMVRNGNVDEAVLADILEPMRNRAISRGDFVAQISANRLGLSRLQDLLERHGRAQFLHWLAAYNDYAERLADSTLRSIPAGDYVFDDYLDGDGQGSGKLLIRCRLLIENGRVLADFAGSSRQVPGNVNCPISVTAAGVLYAFRCLMPEDIPGCAGAFRGISISAPEGSLLNACPPGAVAAGNVETSMRVVDCVLGALSQAIPDRVCAAAHGSMNNLALGWHAGDQPWDYYETMGGGLGGHAHAHGLSAVQAHMTNTLNTPVEVLERAYPMRVNRYELRRGSGGRGANPGGDGITRELLFTGPAQFTLLTERRAQAPWGLQGGEPGQPGVNYVNGKAVAAKCRGDLRPGDTLTLSSAGGGGFGRG